MADETPPQPSKTGPREITKCNDCNEPTFVALVEPDGRPMRFDLHARRLWRIVQVTPSHYVAVPEDVYESHVATCKAINRT